LRARIFASNAARGRAPADPALRRDRDRDAFAFALDSDRVLLPRAAPGLFWARCLLAPLLAIGRSFAVEEANRARDGLRLSGSTAVDLPRQGALSRSSCFLLELVLGVAVVVLYDVTLRSISVCVHGRGRDHRFGCHRYRLRRAGRRIARRAKRCAAARPSRGRAGDARRTRARSEPRSTARTATPGLGPTARRVRHSRRERGVLAFGPLLEEA
jgi:hypothetical protein